MTAGGLLSDLAGSLLKGQSVRGMPCSNRELVEFFLSQRLSQNNYPSSLLRPQGELTDEYDANPFSNGSAVSDSTGVSQSMSGDTHPAMKVLLDSADKFEDLFKQEFSEFSLQLRVSENMTYHGFKSVMDEVFKDGVNWGRIIGLFVFGGTVCLQCVEKDLVRMVPWVADWMTMYLDDHLTPWVESQGGWQTFADVYGNNDAAGQKRSRWKMKRWLLVGGVLLTGVLVGVYMAKKG